MKNSRKIHPTFEEKLPEVIQLFKENDVVNAYAFGSVTSDKFDEKSDIDLIVNFSPDIDPLKTGENWWNLHDSLRALFNREVDLVTERSLKNPYFIKELERTRVPIYG